MGFEGLGDLMRSRWLSQETAASADADSSSRNAASFSSARTMKRFTGRRDVRLHSRLFALSSDGRADGLRIRRHNRARLLGTFAHLPVYSSVAKTLCGETPFGISRITR
jgi:hypothetical protein